MTDYSELLTIDEFRAALAAQDRILISDKTKDAPTVHHPECGHVREENFVEKVVQNSRESGRYFRARNTRLAEEQGAVRCRHCYG